MYNYQKIYIPCNNIVIIISDRKISYTHRYYRINNLNRNHRRSRMRNMKIMLISEWEL